jgi:regulator of cell morphogenesis and NO signaling
MTTTNDMTLAEIVNHTPGAARVLERFGLDYCCGGRHLLTDACTAAGVDPAQVLAEVSAAPQTDEGTWTTMTPAELVDHLEATHHAYLHTELPRLDALAAKVARVLGARHPELAAIRDTFLELRDDLEPHLAKEERVLFPMIRTLATATEAPTFHCGSLRNPISRMLLEHDRAGELLATLRHATGGYAPPDDGCASYRALYAGLAELEADTHLHVHKENNILFPAVMALESRFAAAG